jgi:hypothetical protein
MSGAYRDKNIILCPLCGVPHRLGAVRCESCGQQLNAPVDLAALDDEARRHRANIVKAAFGIAAMIALNVACIGHAGGFVIVTAPLGWLVWSVARYRAIRRRLTRGAPEGVE